MTLHVLDQLPLWVEGDLGTSEQAAVEGHLAGCPACRVAAEQLKTSQVWLREALASPFNASDQDRLRRKVLDQIRAEAAVKPSRRLAARGGLLTACAASLLIATLVWRQGGRHEDSPTAVGPPPAPPVAARPTLEPPPVGHGLTTPSTRLQTRATPIQESASPPTGGPTRIEFQTTDPTIRIIWLAQSGPLPDTHQTSEEKS